MEALLDYLKTNWPDMKLVLITPPPFDIPEFPEAEEKLKKLIVAYEQLAQKRGLPFINNHSWNIQLAYDGAHFTEMGHQVFAVHIQQELSSIL